MTDVRTGQFAGKLARDEHRARYRERFADPAFDAERDAIDRLEQIAWDNYCASRKAPITEKAGADFADPDYDLSVDWLRSRARIAKAKTRFDDLDSKARALVISGSDRNDGTCPGEMAKSFRLAKIVADTLENEGSFDVDFLDLSALVSEPGRVIHPCKGCVSTAMPLCHWPCSCYPNHSLGQVNDWMEEIYERWTAAHGVLIVSPVYWYQATSALKLMLDRLVCADGGNPDPTRTQGKDAARAKEIELAGWDYPKHLAGRAFGVIAHGDAAGAESVRHAIADTLESMGLVDAGPMARLDRYVGYYEPYATSHAALDADVHFQDEARNAARALANAIRSLRSGVPLAPDAGLKAPREK